MNSTGDFKYIPVVTLKTTFHVATDGTAESSTFLEDDSNSNKCGNWECDKCWKWNYTVVGAALSGRSASAAQIDEVLG
ncbi:MAG: hypothetical protein LBR91_00365, partial [Puniceicoccales bacterium]|nr:hypothetical protein [Puniceicoccales bacterium]